MVQSGATEGATLVALERMARAWSREAGAGGVAHYFNNVLAYLVGSLELVGDYELEGEAREYLDRMQARVGEVSQMIRALQQFATQEPPEHLEDMELGELVEEVLELTRPVWDTVMQAGGRQLEVEHVRRADCRVRANRRDLREALINVLFNAIEAMPSGGRIRLTEGAERIWAYIEVTDTGEGMNEEVLKRAREPFYTTRQRQRQGLGLSVASGILRRHGGEVQINSKPKRGTTVRLSLLAAVGE